LQRSFILGLLRNKFLTVAGLAFLLIISCAFLLNAMFMWKNAVTFSEDASISSGVFQQSSNWISQKLEQGEIALVPSSQIFYVSNPEMAGSFVSYSSLWKSAGIVLQANTTDSDVSIVRQYLIKMLKENPEIKYLVRDWVDPSDYKIFNSKSNDELMILLNEEKVIPFTLSTGWSNKITIYSRVAFSNQFTYSFSQSSSNLFTRPENLSIDYGSNGATLNKLSESTGVYLPLDTKLSAAAKNYFTLDIYTDLKSGSLQVVFYYDKNNDGVFSGYDVDYVKSLEFSSNSSDWSNNTLHQIYGIIPPAVNKIVQIGFIVNGNQTGKFTISNFKFYSDLNS
jgi:hypothetical protein